ncbi:MAG: FGGY family carbohydrate kinase [Sulfuricaulis sp.]|nr:FGGY family carbohydrate kinase [Sulfuricaulis sp.]
MPPAAPDSLYLCLDQGGHASRALVFDANGRVVARSVRDVHTQHPHAGWVEHDPEELVESIQAAAADAVHQLGAAAERLHRAGLATQRSSIVCWDKHTGAALSPVLSWQDRRAHAWLERFAGEADNIRRLTGLRLSPHYGASKLRWCLEHLPEVAAAQQTHRLAFGPLASFLIFRLVEERTFAVDSSNAARTMLLNLAHLDWDPTLLSLFDIPPSALPRCVPTCHAYGTLALKGARVPLAVATGDQSAALFAYGEPLPGNAYINVGTGAFVQRLVPEARTVDSLLTGVVAQCGDRVDYVLEGTINGAGAAIEWAMHELKLDKGPRELGAWLMRDADVPLFLNGIGGLGAPYWIGDFPSRFVGEGESWQQLIAVIESIVFLIQRNIELMRSEAVLEKVFVSGGLAAYDGLCQRVADLSGLGVVRPGEGEATARGTAFLLAQRPVLWPTPAGERVFAPRVNAPLRRRYQAWWRAMDAAISSIPMARS